MNFMTKVILAMGAVKAAGTIGTQLAGAGAGGGQGGGKGPGCNQCDSNAHAAAQIKQAGQSMGLRGFGGKK